MYLLRDYQQELIDKIQAEWQAGNRRVLAQLPTGGGKTVVLSHIAREFFAKGEGVLFVAHRKELILQAKEKLESVTGIEAGVIKAGFPQEEHKDLQVASIQSLTRRKFRPDAGLVVIDEAHHASSKTYTDLIDAYPNAQILGLTATPHRSDGQGFKNHFDALVVGLNAGELIKLGQLVKFKIFGAKPISTAGIKTGSNGDFNLSQLQARAMALVGDVVPQWQERALGKQTIVFATGVEHSKTMVELFTEAGFAAEHIDGETPDEERQAIIERFKNKETTILSNVGVFTEGFDVPGIECIQCVRPTRSLVLWLQMIGRGLRPDQNKDHCVIIDHSDNWFQHGLPDDERDWQLEPISLHKKATYALKCQECDHVFRALSHEKLHPVKKYVDADGRFVNEHESKCPCCGEIVPWKSSPGGVGNGASIKASHEGELQEIDLDCTEDGIELINNCIEIQRSRAYKPAWIFYQVSESSLAPKLSLGDWRYLCRYLGYKPGWAMIKYNEVQNQQQLA